MSNALSDTPAAPEKTVVIVRYGELSLKSKGVRERYELALKNNIQQMLDFHQVPYSKVWRDYGRIFVETKSSDAPEIIARVFGVVSVSSAYVCSSKKEDITLLCATVGEKIISDGDTFAIRARRAGNHSFASNEIAAECGDAVWNQLVRAGKVPAVDLTHPDKTIFVEVRQSQSYVYFETVKGPGGFPIGTQGKMVALLSSGIDSPVAAWLMMKRGIEVIPIFFDNGSYMNRIAFEKAVQSAKTIFSWAPGKRHKMYRVFHQEYMEQMIQATHPKNVCVMCKRSMFKIAGEIMKKEGATGILTGNSLGQVASQTSDNMMAEAYGLCLPLYHPLISFDKQEIIDIAQKIGTFDNSIRSNGEKECLAVPEKPEVKALMTAAVDEEKRFGFDLDEVIQKAVLNAEVIEIKL